MLTRQGPEPTRQEIITEDMEAFDRLPFRAREFLRTVNTPVASYLAVISFLTNKGLNDAAAEAAAEAFIAAQPAPEN